VTASEFAFLALGLILGVASGAALIEILRSRPPAPREVRLTVTPDSIPRRATTLAATTSADRGPARGGPADRRVVDRPDDEGIPVGVPVFGALTAGSVTTIPPTARTSVPSPFSPIDPWPAETATPETTSVAARPLVGIAIEPETDRVLASVRPTPAATSVVAAGAAMTSLQDDGSLRRDPPSESPPGSAGDAPRPVGLEPDAATDPCADERRMAEERCAVADRLAAQAEGAAASLRDAQRSYDDHQTRAARAAEQADPRALREAKDAAQAAFREASATAGSPAAVEGAASAWLGEINRINQSAREATTTLRREQEAANALVMVIERLSVEADWARITAEGAREACLQAREAVAACDEAVARGPLPPAVAHATAPLTDPDADASAPADVGAEGESDRLGVAASEAGEPVIFRLLRADRQTLSLVVGQLAGDDPVERRRWQLQVTELVDAILARAIEASCLDFPTEHPFWSGFTRDQSREIVTALASLGYHFDGLGGFSDARVPSQRDLSLAVGFAGLDPMRIRHRPDEAEMAELLRGLEVAGDEYLATTAGGLTLGEMVAMLGRRADGLTDLWNAWGRVRPLMIAAD
jgi:hypothetical protein